MFSISDILFGKIKKAAYLKGVGDTDKQYRARHNQQKDIALKIMLGEEYMAVSNEWENPVIGKVIDIEYIADRYGPYGTNTVPLILDYITGNVMFAGGIYMPYSEHLLRVLVDKMTPYERWAVLSRTHPRTKPEVPEYQGQIKHLNTADELIEIVNKNRSLNVPRSKLDMLNRWV